VEKVLKVLNNFEQFFCVISLAIALILLTYQVITRYVFLKPSNWSEEVARYVYILFVYLGMSYAEQGNAHIRIEVANKLFPKAFRKYVALIGEIVFLVFSGYMAVVCTQYTLKVLQKGQFSLTLHISMGWVYGAIALGFILLSLRILINIFTGKYMPVDVEEVAEQALEDGGAGTV
jgi:TRAP-type C4-dicarboxylate transport system permease small subunit